MDIAIGLMIPFLGTTLGSAMVFFMKNNLNIKVENFLNGFASGVMISASMFSLLLPAIEMSKTQNVCEWIPASVGFLFGFLLLLLLDFVVNKILDKKQTCITVSKKNTMMMLAVVLHNIPEGMAVGVALAGAMMSDTLVTMAGAITIAIGIAIQNFPEGAIISMPLKSEGMTKSKAFLFGTLSGAVEPISSVFTILITSFVTFLLPYLLSFASGAMIFVVVKELVPEFQNCKHSVWGTVGVAVGFVLMMILDISLG